MNPQYYSIDDELERYEQAARFKGSGIPDTPSMADAVAFNAAKNVEEVYTKMPNGGHVKIAERSITDEASLKRYDTALRDAGVTPSVEDYYAAGFDDDQINAAGLAPKQPAGGRTEPLTDYEKMYVERQGGELLEEGQMLTRDALNLGMVRLLDVIGVPEQQANQLADVVIGQVDTSGGTGLFDTSMAAVDFTPVGAAFGIEEIGAQATRDLQQGNLLGLGLNGLFLVLSAAEAWPLTKAGAKGIKKQIPKIRKAIDDLKKEQE